MSLMLIVFGATLTVSRDGARLARQPAAQRQPAGARATDIAWPQAAQPRQPLRHAANEQQPLERANPTTSSSARSRADGAPRRATPEPRALPLLPGPDEVLYEERQTWTGTLPGRPPTTACPGAGWTDHARSRARRQRRPPRVPLPGQPRPGTYSELTSVAPADFPTAIALRTTLYIDPDHVNRAPRDHAHDARLPA